MYIPPSQPPPFTYPHRRRDAEVYIGICLLVYIFYINRSPLTQETCHKTYKHRHTWAVRMRTCQKSPAIWQKRPNIRQQRPTNISIPETCVEHAPYSYGKRDLLIWQKRPNHTAYIWQKRPINTSIPEACIRVSTALRIGLLYLFWCVSYCFL